MNKKMAGIGGSIGCLVIIGFPIVFAMIIGTVATRLGNWDSQNSQEAQETVVGDFTDDIPIYKEIKGVDGIPDDIAQYAVGSAVKYKLLPSVILSQWFYESASGTSLAAKKDNNCFGITHYEGCGFPTGTMRGVGGSEGGYYMRFPDVRTGFSYYGYMVSKQDNFNKCVSNKDPGSCLLILGRGGYAASGITESSPYYTTAMNYIKKKNLVEKYDNFAIKKWGEYKPKDIQTNGKWSWPFPSVGEGSFGSEQTFGYSLTRQGNFHDGLDFGSIDHPGADIHCVKGGKVVFCGNPNIGGLGAVVVVVNDGKYNYVYQEFASSGNLAKVKVGDNVKAGQVIATRNTDHLHLGITEQDWRQAQGSAFVNNGVWKDPLPMIRNGVKNGK